MSMAYRARNLFMIIRHNFTVVTAFMFAFCLAILIFMSYRVEGFNQTTFPVPLDALSRADFFLMASNINVFALCFIPLSLIFMLYCTKNDYLSPRVVRFRHIEAFWLIQATKALLAAALFAAVVTLTVHVMGLSLAEEKVNFESFTSYFAFSTKGFTIENPSLAYVAFMLFTYSFLLLAFVNLIWLVLDAVLPKKWMALVAGIALGILSTTRLSVLSSLVDIRYATWIPVPGVSHGFVNIISAIVFVVALGAIYYRIRGCPRAIR